MGRRKQKNQTAMDRSDRRADRRRQSQSADDFGYSYEEESAITLHSLRKSKKYLIISFVFLIFPVANFGMAWYYNNVEDKLSKELGYPSFARLNVTTFNTNAENLSNLTYDSIREKINRDHPNDGTFL